MSDSPKSFFRSVPGFLTGLAGVVSAGVAAAGLAAQQGWIGGDGGEDAPSVTTVAPAQSGTGGPGSNSPARAGGFSVEPSSIVFQPVGVRDATVRVRNTGEVPLTVRSPRIEGDNPEQFEARNVSCTGSLEPGRSCELKVTFSPRTGRFQAILVVAATGAPKSTEVPLKASAVL